MLHKGNSLQLEFSTTCVYKIITSHELKKSMYLYNNSRNGYQWGNLFLKRKIMSRVLFNNKVQSLSTILSTKNSKNFKNTKTTMAQYSFVQIKRLLLNCFNIPIQIYIYNLRYIVYVLRYFVRILKF